MATVKELLTNLGDSTRKFLGTSDTLSLEDMAIGVGKASDESDFQTELIEEFSNILDRSAAPDSYANGKEDGYADALDKRTDLVVTENGDYTPPDGSTGFKSVTVEVSGGSGLDAIWEVDGTTPTEIHSNATSVREYAFYKCPAITVADFPNATSVGERAFQDCVKLKTAYLPKAESLPKYAFDGCVALSSIDLPEVTSLSNSSLSDCREVTALSLPKLTSLSGAVNVFSNNFKLLTVDLHSFADMLPNQAFYNCYVLRAIILRSETMCTLYSSSVFENCYHIKGEYDIDYNPSASKDCYIYVPRASVEDYRSATNWSAYADRFRALEDYTVDGTITGALDPNKI